VDASLGGERVVRVLERLKEQRPSRVDRDGQRTGVHHQGARYLGARSWRRAPLHEARFADRERLRRKVNGRFREKCLSENWFTNLLDARDDDRDLETPLRRGEATQLAFGRPLWSIQTAAED